MEKDEEEDENEVEALSKDSRFSSLNLNTSVATPLLSISDVIAAAANTELVGLSLKQVASQSQMSETTSIASLTESE